MPKFEFNQERSKSPLEILMIVLLILTFSYGVFLKFQVSNTVEKITNIENRLEELKTSLNFDENQSVKLQVKKSFFDKKSDERKFLSNFFDRIIQIKNTFKDVELKTVSLSNFENFQVNFLSQNNSEKAVNDTAKTIRTYLDSKNFINTFTPSVNISSNINDEIETKFSIQGEYKVEKNEELFPKTETNEVKSRVEKIQEQLKSNN